jgi:hypothetical protein
MGVGRVWAVLAVMVMLAATAGSAAAQQRSCSRDDFEAAVDEAAASLRDLTKKNRPAFQDLLRQLKDKRGWSHDQFIVEAAPFVKDGTIEEFDARSDAALSRLTAMGQAGSQSRTPDCRLLVELRGHMQALVDIQTEKWRYMFGRIEAELAK